MVRVRAFVGTLALACVSSVTVAADPETGTMFMCRFGEPGRNSSQLSAELFILHRQNQDGSHVFEAADPNHLLANEQFRRIEGALAATPGQRSFELFTGERAGTGKLLTINSQRPPRITESGMERMAAVLGDVAERRPRFGECAMLRGRAPDVTDIFNQFSSEGTVQ